MSESSDRGPRPRVGPTATLLILFAALAIYGVFTVLLPGLREEPGEDVNASGASSTEPPATTD